MIDQTKEPQLKETLVMRIEKKLKDRLEDFSLKRRDTLTSITTQALKKYLDENEYSFEDLLNIIERIPSLRINLDKIKNEMEGCPPDMCKQIIDSISNKKVFLFEEPNLDSLVERIEKIEKNNLYGVFVHITSKAQEDINKVNESMIKISEILKNKKLNLGAGMKSNHHDKILLFVSYNKEEGDNETET